MKPGLGTAQFGLDYGISNKTGKTGESEVQKILKLAHANGFEYLDTAFGYGSSQEVLGRCLSPEYSFRIVTKTIAAEGPHAEISMRRALAKSQSLLKTQSVYGLLVHRFGDLVQYEKVYDVLLSLREEGVVRRIGASLYSSDEVVLFLNRFPRLDIVQIPVSLLDQRMLRSGAIRRLHDAGVEIHVRSVFLQGLIFLMPHELPEYFRPIAGFLAEFHERIGRLGISAYQAAVAFVNSLPQIHCALFGVNAADQLLELISALRSPLSFDPSEFELTDERFLNPATWKLTRSDL